MPRRPTSAGRVVTAEPDRFASCILKLDRAKHHLRDLADLAAAYAATAPGQVTTRLDRNDEGTFVVLDTVPDPITGVEVVLGDLLNNLRCALDHYAAAVSQRPEKSSFPVWPKNTSQKPWAKHVRESLPGAPHAVIQAVTALQLQPGGAHERITQAARLNNIDKHRLVLAVATGQRHVDLDIWAMAAAGSPAMAEFYGDEPPPEIRLPLKPADFIPLESGARLFGVGPDATPAVVDAMSGVRFGFDLCLNEPAVMPWGPLMPALDEMVDAVGSTLYDLFAVAEAAV